MKPNAKLDEAVKRLDWIRPRLPKALALTHNWGGLGYGTGSNGNGRGSGTSNPTENVAISVADKKLRDEFGKRYADAVSDAQIIEDATRRLEKFIQSTDLIAEASGSTADGCEPCAKVRDQTTGKAHEAGFQPVRERRVRPGDSEFAAKVRYCSFHSEWIERYGIEPAPAIDLWHLDHPGRAIPYQMIRDWHPEEFSRAQSKAAGRTMGRTNLDLREPV